MSMVGPKGPVMLIFFAALKKSLPWQHPQNRLTLGRHYHFATTMY